MKRVFLIGLLLSTFSMECLAEERYSLTKLSNGTVRLDHRTGAISYCREKDGNFICSLTVDERQAWISETEDLSNRIGQLEERLKALEASSNKLTQNKADDTSSNEKWGADEAIDFMDDTIRRFSDVFEDLKRDWKQN